jgi:hypothetical protein
MSTPVRTTPLALKIVMLYAAGQIGVVAALTVSHWKFPLFLETMEGIVLEHAARFADGLSIYPWPTSEFVALAYTPLFYVICAPLIWMFGPDLTALRIMATVGYALALWATFAAVRNETRDWRWGLLAVGLFAAAYKVMDAYLDTAHSDSWMLASALLGTLMIDRSRRRATQLLGVAVLCAAFWFKQHGALFAIGGIVYIALRMGPRQCLPAFLLAAFLGPGLYAVAPILFGPATYLFTFVVPSAWSELGLNNFYRLAVFLALSYPILLALCIYEYASIWRQRFKMFSIWHVQGIAALASGVMATLDTGGAINTYIPLGVFTILIGTMGLARAAAAFGDTPLRQNIVAGIAALCFAPLVYDPRPLIPDASAPLHYQRLISRL